MSAREKVGQVLARMDRAALIRFAILWALVFVLPAWVFPAGDLPGGSKVIDVCGAIW